MIFDINQCGRDERGRAMVTYNGADCVLICDTPSSNGLYFIEHPRNGGFVDSAPQLTPRRAAPKLQVPEKVCVRIFYDVHGRPMGIDANFDAIGATTKSPITEHTFDPRLIPVDELIAAGSLWPDAYVCNASKFGLRNKYGDFINGHTDYRSHAAAHLAASNIHRETNK